MKSYIISGAGSGIGRAMAQKLGERQDTKTIYLVGRNQEKLDRSRESIRSNSVVVSCDISQRDQTVATLTSALSEEDCLHGVIANAGIGGENHFKAADGDRWDDIIHTNVTGTYVFVNACLEALRRSTHAFKHVILTSSILARLGVPGYSAYCASKAALLGLNRSWAIEWAKDNILVNTIAPGWVDTDMATQGLEQMSEAFGKPLEDVREEQMAMVPLRKMSSPAEIAALVGFLVSEQQTSLTGQTLDINNGAMMP